MKAMAMDNVRIHIGELTVDIKALRNDKASKCETEDGFDI